MISILTTVPPVLLKKVAQGSNKPLTYNGVCRRLILISESLLRWETVPTDPAPLTYRPLSLKILESKT